MKMKRNKKGAERRGESGANLSLLNDKNLSTLLLGAVLALI
jgi:hypothetical protein